MCMCIRMCICLDGPSVRVYKGVVVAVILHCPVHPLQLKDRSDHLQHPAPHYQVLPSQHILQVWETARPTESWFRLGVCIVALHQHNSLKRTPHSSLQFAMVLHYITLQYDSFHCLLKKKIIS